MSERLIIVAADAGYVDSITAMAERLTVLACDVYAVGDDEKRRAVHLLVSDENRQAVLDYLQSVLGSAEDWRITILPVEATVPRPEEVPSEERKESKRTSGESREELYDDVAQNARLDRNFLIFVALSTLVAAIGLIENNVAVVIGAMLIAPLLGPNLAFALGVALGDRRLMGRALGTNGAGLAFTLAICFLLGLMWPFERASDELMARTDVGFDGIALALASGAAAALSLTAGLSSTLVGVMVAVALLPPAATMGLMAGAGFWRLALGALLLLAVNVVCVNLSAQIVFVLRGVTPRTWWEKEVARRAVRLNAAIWFLLLAALAGLLLARNLASW